MIASIVKNFDMVSDTEAKDFAVFGQVIIQPVKKFNIKFTKRVWNYSEYDSQKYVLTETDNDIINYFP